MGNHRMTRKQRSKFDPFKIERGHDDWRKRKQGKHQDDRDKRRKQKDRQYDDSSEC